MRKIICLLLIVLLCVLSGCAENAEVPELLVPVGAQQDTATVTRGDICEIAGYDYSVAPQVHEITLEVSGTVGETVIPIGTKVEIGDVLLTYDVENTEKQLASLKKERDYNQTDNEYTLALMQMDIDLCKYEMENRDYKSGGEKEEKKQNELASLQSAYAQTVATQNLQMSALDQQIAELEEIMDKSVIYAPVAGTVVYTVTEENLYAGEIACIIAEDDNLVLRGEYLTPSLLEYAAQIQARIGTQVVSVTPVPQDESEVIAKRSAGSEVFTEFTVNGELPAGTAVGDYVYLMVTTNLHKNVLWLPPNAIYHDATESFVYKKTDSGKEKVTVTLGKKLSTAVEITSGLQEGDVVYVP